MGKISIREKLIRDTVTVNRAPLLTLWMSLVALRQGFSRCDSLRAGRAISGMLAEAKGKRLGIFIDKQAATDRQAKPARGYIEIAGFRVPAERIDKISVDKVRQYLERSFKNDLDRTVDKLTSLCNAYHPAKIGERAFALYETFRPDIDEGQAGWGQRGILYFQMIDRLRSQARSEAKSHKEHR